MAATMTLLDRLAPRGRGSGLSRERRRELARLCRRLGVRLRDPRLLNQALMHRSFVHDADMERGESNERMEFLGDSVLGLVVNEHLYYQYAKRQEGRLTKIKSLVVSEAVLSRTAEELGLGEFILLSENERTSGGATRASILADSFEAVIGAVYLDSGLPAARRFVERHLLVAIDELLEVEEYKNYKSVVQEYAQKKLGVRPRYRVVSAKGPEHERTFFVELRLGGRALGRGEGKNKKEAEQMAARGALRKIGLGDDGKPVKQRKKRGSRRGGRGRGRSRRRKKEQPA
jgi:ribonuclease-3